MRCTNEWDLYRDASCDYSRGVYDLVHKYNMTGHCFKSRAGSSTWIYVMQATYPMDSTSCK